MSLQQQQQDAESMRYKPVEGCQAQMTLWHGCRLLWTTVLHPGHSLYTPDLEP